MKFSHEWLSYFLRTDASVEEIAARLNAIGIEVEGVENPAEALAGFRVAKVLTAAPHPDADKLQVLTVDTGGGEPQQVVCGAPNARAGLVGVLGSPGAVVPANGMELRKAAIRGVESNGMMCSSRELGLGDDHEGIIELPDDAALGTSFAEYRAVSPIFDVAITPNRPDCMSVYGIARDLAASGLGEVVPLRLPEHEGQFPCPVDIRIEDLEGCPAFYGRVIRGVTNGASPEWMQRRLLSAGQRPISALVDLTNYLMLAFGRPAHVYDLAKLSGPVVARRARDGETILALNEKTYTLDSDMIVIADDVHVHDIGGIMGGQHSGVSEDTRDVLLEIAYFDPASIGVTGRRLGIASDARARFERGLDPAFLDGGLSILTDLVLRFCGGEPSEIVRAGSAPDAAKVVPFDPALTERLGGVAVPQDEQRAILERLEFDVGDDWQVTCPPRRHDIEGPADLVEEIVRIHGLDKVESVALPRVEGVARPTATPQQALERRLRRAAAGRGLDEAVTWTFIPVAQAEHFSAGNQAPWVLDNPISEDMKAMRPSLLPGLIAAAKRNVDRGATSLRLFEIGRAYLRGADGRSDERPVLGLVLAGEKTPRGWDQRVFGGRAVPFDAYDAKAHALALLAEAGAPVDKLQVAAGTNGGAGEQFHPGQSATLRLGPKNVLARFGALHPKTLSLFDIDGPVVAAEIFVDALPASRKSGFARTPFSPPALQSVSRDFAFLVPAQLPAGDLLRTVSAADKANIAEARIFDDFRGPGVPEGRKSLAIEVQLQPAEASYTDDQLKSISDRIVAAAEKLGAELRG